MKTPPEIIWLCPKCKEEGDPYNPLCGDNICPKHKIEMQEIDINIKEYLTITDISEDVSFLEAMIKLKETDIVEYQLKMSQFRSQTQNDKAEENVPKCPTCGSANIEKISLTKKAVGGAMFGLFSSNVRKTMHCKNCGYKW